MSEQANMAARYEREIPEGYEARIEGNKVILEKKESEDERIRKSIILLLQVGGYMKSEDKAKAIAYLEEHKESTWTAEDESFVKHILPRILNPDKWTLDQISADKRQLTAFIERQKRKYAKEQQPVKWSEEDEHCMHQLILFCENCMQQDSEAIRCSTWLKSLPERFNLQPKQEWSEGTKKMLDEISDYLKYKGREEDADFIRYLHP